MGTHVHKHSKLQCFITKNTAVEQSHDSWADYIHHGSMHTIILYESSNTSGTQYSNTAHSSQALQGEGRTIMVKDCTT